MKIYKVDFQPVWPVPCGLVIAANSYVEARQIAKNTLEDSGIFSRFKIEEVPIEEPCVVFFEPGAY